MIGVVCNDVHLRREPLELLFPISEDLASLTHLQQTSKRKFNGFRTRSNFLLGFRANLTFMKSCFRHNLAVGFMRHKIEEGLRAVKFQPIWGYL